MTDQNFKFKARIPWNKNKKLTKKHKENISRARKGKPAWNKGLKWPEEVKERIRQTTLKQYRP
ncbi:MAG: NUMOD3 domain-containing DNA-binding protein [bacterium]